MKKQEVAFESACASIIFLNGIFYQLTLFIVLGF